VCALDGTNKDDKPGLVIIQEIKKVRMSTLDASRFEIVAESNGATTVYYLQCLVIPGIIPDPAAAVRGWVEKIQSAGSLGIYEPVNVVDEGEAILESGFLLKKGGGTSGWLAGTNYSERWFELRGRKFRNVHFKRDAGVQADVGTVVASTLRYYKCDKDSNGTLLPFY